MLGLFRRKAKALGVSHQPDIEFAAKGMSPVMAARMAGSEDDLHLLIDGVARSLREQGCTSHQYMSARWGGIVAKVQDLSLYSNFLTAYEDTLVQAGVQLDHSKTRSQAKFQAASTMMVVGILQEQPDEFARYMARMGPVMHLDR